MSGVGGHAAAGGGKAAAGDDAGVLGEDLTDLRKTRATASGAMPSRMSVRAKRREEEKREGAS